MDCALYEHGFAGAFAVARCLAMPEPWWRTAISVATPFLVLLSALIAWRSLKNTRAVARQRATLDLIEKVESTEHYRRLATAFADINRQGRFAALNDPQGDADKAARQAVLDYLNHYELVAIGIHHDILDDTIYRTWMRGHVVMEWNAARPFVQGERWRLTRDGRDLEYRPELFANFQRAACRWSREAEPLYAGSMPKPAVPTGEAGPGDVALPG